MTKSDYTKALVRMKKPKQKAGGIRKSGGSTSSKSKKRKLEKVKYLKVVVRVIRDILTSLW